MKNKKIRQAIENQGLKYWEVAAEIGINRCTLTEWLRQELTGDRLARVENAINQLSKERVGV